MEGYVNITRSILTHPVFAHQVALKIWIWCLLKASYKERSFTIKAGRGSAVVTLKPGQFMFGRLKAEEELDVDGSTIYRWIEKFKSEEWGLIEIETNNQYSIITICNWAIYQNGKAKSEQQTDNEGTTNEQQIDSE